MADDRERTGRGKPPHWFLPALVIGSAAVGGALAVVLSAG